MDFDKNVVLTDFKKRRFLLLCKSDVERDHNFALENEYSKNGLMLLTVEEFYSLEDNLKINNSVLPEPGMMLMISNYDHNKYYELDKISEDMAVEKMNHLVIVLQYLGVKKIESTNVFIEVKKEEKSNKTGGEKGLTKGEIDVNSQKELDLRKKFEVNFYTPNLTNQYNSAINYMEKYNLLSDNDFTFLKELRNPMLKNDNCKYERSFTLTESINSSLRIVASLGIPMLSINNDYKSVLETKQEIYTKLLLEF